MKRFIALFAILLLVPLTVFSQTKAEKQAYKQSLKNRDKYLFAAKPLQKNFSHTLSFEYYHGQIIVPVVIRDKTYSFIFDTGAVSAVSDELKEILGLQSIFTNKLVDASGQVEELQMYGIGQVQLGPLVFKDVVGPSIDMAKFEKQFCKKMDGIIGANIMRTCHWKIDYNAKTITFSDKKIQPEGSVTAIDFEENFSGTPIAKHSVGEYGFHSTIDTGSNGGFSISDSLFFNSRKLKGAKMLVGRGKSSLTYFDTKFNYEYVVIMDSIYMGNNLLKNQLVDITAGDTYITGNKVFEKFGTMILDWEKKKVYFPETNISEDKTYVTFGLLPVFSEDNLQVGMVWENSIEGINEIDPGDMVISINGIPAKDIPHDKWCEIVEIFTTKDDKRTLPITVRKKDGNEKEFILQRTDLFSK